MAALRESNAFQPSVVTHERMKKTLVITLAIILASCGFNDNISTPPTSNEDFNCVLSVKSETIKLGDVPKFEVMIENNTNDTVVFIGSLDGSDVCLRLPYCLFIIDRPFFSSPVETYGRCGNLNSIRLSDFVKVPPHKSFDPYLEIDDYGFFGAYNINDPNYFANKGMYKVQFYYSTVNSRDTLGIELEFYEEKHQDISEFYELVPKVELFSNVVEFEIK